MTGHRTESEEVTPSRSTQPTARMPPPTRVYRKGGGSNRSKVAFDACQALCCILPSVGSKSSSFFYQVDRVPTSQLFRVLERISSGPDVKHMAL